MRIEVLMSSGEVDGYTDDAQTDTTFEVKMGDDGYLHIMSPLVPSPSSPTDEEIEKMTNVVRITSQVDQGPDLPPADLTLPYLVRCTYAPGMWMKVTYKS